MLKRPITPRHGKEHTEISKTHEVQERVRGGSRVSRIDSLHCSWLFLQIPLSRLKCENSTTDKSERYTTSGGLLPGKDKKTERERPPCIEPCSPLCSNPTATTMTLKRNYRACRGAFPFACDKWAKELKENLENHASVPSPHGHQLALAKKNVGHTRAAASFLTFSDTQENVLCTQNILTCMIMYEVSNLSIQNG